jgi:hypothetical protein
MHCLVFCLHDDQVVHTIVIQFNHTPYHYFRCVRMLNLSPSFLRMRPLGPRVRCTLQIDFSSRIFSILIAQPLVLAFPASQKHHIHQSASTRQDEANRQHKDGAEAVEISSSSLRTLSTAKDPSKGAPVPPIREPRPQLDEDPNSFPAFPQQSVQVRSNSVIECCIVVTHKLLGRPCFAGIPCSVYPDRETIPLWK